MTSHITVSVWNYCQNNCPYCVSNSNRKEWNWNGNFQTFCPKKNETGLTPHDLIQRYGPGYYEHMCMEKKKFLKASDVLRVDSLCEWLKKNKPNSYVYLSGGEPLLRPDIYGFAKQLVDDGHKVIIMTNGMLIKQNKDLFELPLFWFVTHHATQNSFSEWKSAIDGVQNHPHIVTRIRSSSGKKFLNHELQYADLNFYWRTLDGGFEVPSLIGTRKKIASDYMHLICPDGSVWPCNTQKWGVIGYVYTGEYRPRRVEEVEKGIGKCLANCGAYQTAQIVELLWKD